MAKMKVKQPWLLKKNSEPRPSLAARERSKQIGHFEALESRELLSDFHPVEVKFQWTGRRQTVLTDARFDETGNFLGTSGIESWIHAGGLIGGGLRDPNVIQISLTGQANPRSFSPDDVTITGDLDPADPFRAIATRARRNTLTIYTAGRFSTAPDADLTLGLRDIEGRRPFAVPMDPWSITVNITTDSSPCLECPVDPAPTVLGVIPAAGSTVNQSVTFVEAQFSEDLLAASVQNPLSMSLVRSGGDGIFGNGNDVSVTPASISYNANTDRARYSFASALVNDSYRLQLVGAGPNAILDLNGNSLDGNGNGLGGDNYSAPFTVSVDPIAPPRVVSIAPQSGTSSTQSPEFIEVSFDRALAAGTITNPANFQLFASGDGVFGNGNDGTITPARIDYDAATAQARMFITGRLPSDLYMVRLSGSIQDTAGRNLDGNSDGFGGDAFTSTFRIERETTPPTVVSITPSPNVVFTQSPPSAVDVRFSEDLLASSVTNPANFLLSRSNGDGGFNNGNEIAITANRIEYDAVNRQARYLISGTLPNDVYMVRLRGQGGVQDLAGNELDGDPNRSGADDFTSVFQVNVPPPQDLVPPTVALITPPENKVLSAPPREIVVEFSEPMNANTIIASNFRILERGIDASFSRSVPLTVSYVANTNTVRVIPSQTLAEDIHVFRISAAVRDLFGNQFDGNEDGRGGDDFVSSFAISSSVALQGGDPPDPFGDTTATDGFGRVPNGAVVHDIESVGVVSDEFNAYFRATFFGDIQPASRNQRNSLFGLFDVDGDQRFATGSPSAAAAGDGSKQDVQGEQIAGATTHLLGDEFYIDLGSEAANPGQVKIFGTTTGTWLLDLDGGRNVSAGETPFVFQPIGTRVFIGDWNGTGRKALGSLQISTETLRSHRIYVDRDGNNRYDSNEDLDGDGVLDVQEIDIDGDGVVDPNEDLDRLSDGTPQPDGKFDRAEDRDADNFLDNDGPFTLGNPTDLPAPIVLAGDTDGDGKDNVVLFDATTARFLVDVDGDFRDSAADVITTTFATAGDIPFVGDFDGDGRAEIAVFRAGTGFVVDADNDFQDGPGDARMSDFVSEDLNRNGFFNNGVTFPALSEIVDARDYNNDGDMTDIVSEDINQDGLFNNGIAGPLLDELTEGRDFNNDGDLHGFTPFGGIYYTPLSEAADLVDYNNDGDILDTVSEDLNGDGFFNDGTVRPLLDEITDNIDYNRNGIFEVGVSEDLNLDTLFNNISADIPVVGDWDGIFETDFNGNGSEDLNRDGAFNNGVDAPALNEVLDDVDYNRDGDKLDLSVSEDRGNLGVFNNGIVGPLLADASEDFNGNGVIDGKTVDIGWYRTSTSEMYLNRNAAATGGFTRLFSSQTREPSEDTNRDGILATTEDTDPDGPGPLLPNGLLDFNDGPMPFPRFDTLIADASTADTVLGQQDFNGDGRDDIGFFRPQTGEFFIDQTGDGLFQRGTEGPFLIGSPPTTQFPADVPTVGDLDGDGDSDIGVFRRRGDAAVGLAPIFFRNRSFTIKVPLGLIGETPVQIGVDADFMNFGLVVGSGPIFASMTDEVPNICLANVCNPADPPLGQFDPPGTTVPRVRPFASGPLAPTTINGIRTNLGPITFVPPAPPTFTTATGYPTTIIVDFSGPIDPSTVDTTTVLLFRTGDDGVFGNGNDVQVFPSSISITNGPASPGTNDQINFVLPTVPAIPGDDYRFVVRGDDPVRDVNGVPIDGEFSSLLVPSGNGSAEGDFEVPLRIDRPPTITVVRLTNPDDRGVPEISDTGVLNDGSTNDRTPTYIGTVSDERLRSTLDPIADTFGTAVTQIDLAGISAEFSTSGQVAATTELNDVPTLAISLAFQNAVSLPSATSGGPSVYGFVDLDTDQNGDTGGVAWFQDLNGDLAYAKTSNLTANPPVIAEGPLPFGIQSGDPDTPVVPVLGNWFVAAVNDKIDFGVYDPFSGVWHRDLNGNGTLETATESSPFTNVPGRIPLVGNFFEAAGIADDGKVERGEYDSNPASVTYGSFFLDINGNDTFEDLFETFAFVAPPADPPDDQEDVPLIGDWNGNGIADIAVYRPSGIFPDGGQQLFPGQGIFFVDVDADRFFDLSEDRNGDGAFTPGGPPIGEDTNLNGRLDLNDGPFPFSIQGGQPVVGDWNGNGVDKVGVYLPANSSFVLDINGNRISNPGEGPFIYGNPGDRGIVGDWDGDNATQLGVYRSSTRQFLLDFDSNRTVGLTELNIFSGSAGTIPIVGDFDGDTQGKAEVGTFLAQDASAQSSLGSGLPAGLGSEFVIDLGSELLHPAEDRDGDGQIDNGEDLNTNDRLDPGFVDVIDARTGLKIDFDPVAPGVQGTPITLFPNNRGILIKVPLDAIGEAGDGNVNLGAVVGTLSEFTDEVPENGAARSSQAILLAIDSDRNLDPDGNNVFDNGVVVTVGFGQFVVTVANDTLEDGIYNGLGTNFQQLAFRATDEGSNTDLRLNSAAVDTDPALILGYASFEDGTLSTRTSVTYDKTPKFFQVTLDERLDPIGPVLDLLNYRLLAADGTDHSGNLVNVQYNSLPTPVRDQFDEDLNNDNQFNNGVNFPLLDEAADGVDYNKDGVFAFVSEDRNGDGMFDIFDQSGTIPGNTIRIHTAPGLPSGVFTVIVKDTVVDLSGNLLDGENFGESIFPPSGNGVAGGDFEATFTINGVPPHLDSLTAIGPGPDNIIGTVDDIRSPVVRQFFDNNPSDGLDAPFAPLAFEAVFSQPINSGSISTGTATSPCAGTVVLYRSGNDGVFGNADTCMALRPFNAADLSPDGHTLRVFVDLQPGETLPSDYYRLTLVGGDPQFVDDPTVRFDSPRTDVPITDGGLITDTISINVPPNVIVTDINVLLDITHQIPQDLDLFLVAPGGSCGGAFPNITSTLTCVELFSDVGSVAFNGAAFRDTVLDDQAGTPIINANIPFTGSFRPEGQLSLFNGLTLAGVWTLLVVDDVANNAGGTLDTWSMIVVQGLPIVEVGANVDVSVDSAGAPLTGYQGTVAIDLNRDEPLHLVSAYNNGTGAASTVQVNYSRDDGGVWTPANPIDLNVGGSTFTTSRDPSLANQGGVPGVDPEVVYLGLQASNGGAPGSGTGADDNAVLVARSNDGGATFTQVTAATLNRSAGTDVYDDKPDIDSDRVPAPNEQGNVYASWIRTGLGPPAQLQEVDFLHSTDGGLNFIGDAAATNPKLPMRVDRSVDCPGTPGLDDCTITRFNSTTGAFDIPDNNTILDTLSIEYSPLITVQDVDVLLNINHTFTPDLDIFLVGPNGQRVRLFTDVPCVFAQTPASAFCDNDPFPGFGQNFAGTRLDDEALVDIEDFFNATAPFSGRFRPEQPLSLLDGVSIDGSWTLEVTDDLFNGESGTVLSWSLIFTHQTSGGVANVNVAAATVDNNGPFYLVDQNATPFAFVDLSNPGSVPPGTVVNRGLGRTDDASIAATIPFTFDYFGTGYNSLFLSTNGLMSFVNPVASSNNVDLTAANTPAEPVIAPFWDNLQFTAGGTDQVYFTTIGPVGGRQFITQWNQVGGFPASPSQMTFQVVLFETTNIIEMRYPDVVSADFRGGGNSATVGIRNANPPALSNTPPQVFQLSFNTVSLSNNQLIRFTPSATREVYVSWEDWSRGTPADPTGPTPGTPPEPVSLIKVDVSRDAGTTWGVDVVAAATHVNGYFDTANPTCNVDSTKVTRPYCYRIPSQPDRGISATPQLALDPRLPSVFGPSPRLFLVYTDQGDEDIDNNGILDPSEDLDPDGLGGPLVPNGIIDRVHDNTDIMLTYSDDGGINWRTPIQVNDDLDSTLAATATTRATLNSQFFPSLSVDPSTGVLHLMWYDTRLDPANQRANIFYTTAVPDRLTGDLTFPNPNIRISDVTLDESGLGRNTTNFGDYTGIAVGNAVAHPAWTDTRLGPGNEEVRTSRVTGRVDTITTTNLGHIEDTLGNFLDGEALGFTSSDIGLPSGDGQEGGNFVTGFIVTDNVVFVQSDFQPDPLRPPIGTTRNPFPNVQTALGSLSQPSSEPAVLLLREADGTPYVIEPPGGGLNGTITIPGFTTMVVEAGAVLKLRAANIDVGGPIPQLAGGAVLQLRGEGENRPVIVTSLKNDQVGGDTNLDGNNSGPQASDWGGIVFRNGSDDVLSILNGSEIHYGGGPVPRAIGPRWDAVYLESARPAITNNIIANNGTSALPRDAQAAISANFNSFIIDTFDPNTTGRTAAQIGPLIRNNVLRDNSLNALRLRPDDPSLTALNFPRATLTNGQIARWDDTDIVHVLTTEAVISTDATFEIDPGLIIKLDFAALTINSNRTNVTIGDPTKAFDAPVVFTSVYDDSFGGDTNNDGIAGIDPLAVRPRPGDWSGIVEVGGQISSGQVIQNTETTLLMDEAIIKFAGGQTPDAVVRSALIIGTPSAPEGTGPGFYQITRNQFIDNLDSAITVQPEVLRADDPTTPRVEDPLFRDNILRNDQFQSQRNGMEIGRFPDGINHLMGLTPGVPAGQIALGTSSLWDDPDIVHMLGRTLIALGGPVFFQPPILYGGTVFGRRNAEQAFMNALAPEPFVSNLRKVDFDDLDLNPLDADVGNLQPGFITGDEWFQGGTTGSSAGVRFTNRNISPSTLRIDHKGTGVAGSLRGCDPFVPNSSFPPSGFPPTTIPTPANVAPFLPFNEDADCDGVRDANEPDSDGDGQLDMGFNRAGDPRSGPASGINAITTAGSQNALNLRMTFSPPVYAIGFWLVGSNLTDTTESVQFFDCNNNPIRTDPSNAASTPLQVNPLPTGLRIPAGTLDTGDIFLAGTDVIDNFFVGVQSIVAMCRVDIFESAGLEENGDDDFRDTVGVDDLYFTSTPQFPGNSEPPVVLTLSSLPTSAELLTPNGDIYEKLQSAESLVVKLGDMGRGFSSSPDVGQTPDEVEGLVRENVGAGFQFGVDDGIDAEQCPGTQCRAAQDWGTGSAFRSIGIPGNEATGEPGARVILTSFLDDSIGPKGLPGVDATADTDGNGLFFPGQPGGPNAGDWGDIFIGSRSAEDLDAQDIPRPYDRVLTDPTTGAFLERARILPSVNHVTCEVSNPSGLVANDPCYGSIIIDTDVRFGSRLRFQSASFATEAPIGFFGVVSRAGLPLAGILPGIEEEFHAITVAQSILTNYRDFGVWAHEGIERSCPSEDISPWLLNSIFAFEPTRNDPTAAAIADMVGVFVDGFDPCPNTPTRTPQIPTSPVSGLLTPFDGVFLHNTIHGNSIGLQTVGSGGPTGFAMNNLFSQNGTAGTGGEFSTFNMFFNSGPGFGSPAINFQINAANGSRPFADTTIFLDPANLDFRLRLESRGEDVNENGRLDLGEDVNNNGILDGKGLKNPAIDSALSEFDESNRPSSGHYAFQINDPDNLVQLPTATTRTELGPEKDFFGSLRQDDRRVSFIGAGGRPWFDIGAAESREFNAPVVNNVQLVVNNALTVVGPGTPGVTVNVSPTQIILTFSEDLDPRTVTRQSFVLRDSLQSVIPISSLSFDAGTNRTTNAENTATLVPAISLPDDVYTLTLLGFGSEAITDIDGIRLDGEFGLTGYPSGNGLPGGNFVATFAVQEAPRITKVVARTPTDTTALDSTFPPAQAFRLDSPPTSIEATFSEVVTVPPSAFRLFASGADKVFGSADDVPIAGTTLFDNLTLVATFTPTNLAAMPTNTLYRVELDGTGANAITDLSNIPLDGENNEPATSTSGNGQSGGDWIGNFRVGNLIFENEQTIFVDVTNTSGQESGTALAPYNTIQEALDAVDETRRIVQVLPGTYFENVRFNNLLHNGVTLFSRDGDGVTRIVVALNEDANCNGLRDANEPDRDNDGDFDIACNPGGPLTNNQPAPVDEKKPAVEIDRAININLQGFQITSSGLPTFTHPGETMPSGGVGVRVLASNALIQRNTIFDNRTGVLIDIGTPGSAPRLENNIVWANNGTGIEVRGRVDVAAEIVNNTIVFNVDGIRVVDTGTGIPLIANIFNNIVVGSTAAGIRSLNTAGATIDFNDVFGNLGGNYINVQQIGTHNISVDPLFLGPVQRPTTGRPNPNTANWRLGSFSPAIDAALGSEDVNGNGSLDQSEDQNGNNRLDQAPSTDHDANRRFDDPNVFDFTTGSNSGRGLPDFVDIGAFERLNASSGPPGNGQRAAATAVRALDVVLESSGRSDGESEHSGRRIRASDSWLDTVDDLLENGSLKKHRLLEMLKGRSGRGRK